MSKARRLHQRRGWAWTVVITILRPLLMTLTKRRWIDGDKIPEYDGCVVVVNHVSHLDPLTLGHFLHDHGRLVRYLAKDGLWRTPVVGPIIANAQQIPVARAAGDPAHAFEAAVEAVRRGEVIGVYPEGSITRDPEGWPMRGKTGAARIALATGCPVIPIGQWGAQAILPAYTKRPHLFPRKTVTIKVGDPVDLDDLRELPLTNEVLREATDRIMAAVTSLVEDVRGGHAPETRFDPRQAGVAETGDYLHHRPQDRQQDRRQDRPGSGR